MPKPAPPGSDLRSSPPSPPGREKHGRGTLAQSRTEPLVSAEKLGRIFDVSGPWLARLLERSPRQLLVAVADVSFAIEAKETLALVGESGSGKSTIAKMVVGLVPPTSGEVFIHAVAMHAARQGAQRKALRRRIQMVFQDPYASLNPRWRARDIIAEPIRAFRLASRRFELTAKVDELLRIVGLDAADGSKYPHEFSGGQRQRIAIARALASEPEFVVCDEPTSALDVSVQAQILNLMRDLQDRFGLTYLFISHNLAVVRHMAHRVGVMYLGRLVELAPAGALFASPRHPYTRMLLDAVPDLDLSGRARKPVEGEIPNPLDPPPGCSFHPRCPFANARCREERPLLRAAGPGLAACHAVEEGRI
jgi:peptide/nickel transport system ATP-binding protein